MSEQELSAQEFPFSSHYLRLRRHFAGAAPFEGWQGRAWSCSQALGRKKAFPHAYFHTENMVRTPTGNTSEVAME